MDVITNVSLALGLAADAFVVSISSGLTIRNMKINKALKIALFFGVFQAIMPLIGWLVGLTLRGAISEIDHWIAFGLLSLIGGKMIYEALQDDVEQKKFNPLDTYTLVGLSIATSLDALAVGFSFAVLKTSIAAPITLIGFITFFLSFIGVFIGHKCGVFCQKQVEILGGLVLIAIGSKILIEHLLN